MAEAVYRNALSVELQNAVNEHGCTIATEVVREIVYNGVCVGHHRFDLMLGTSCVVEAKVVKTGDAPTAAHVQQVDRYMRHRRPGECVVLVVFGENTVTTNLYQ